MWDSLNIVLQYTLPGLFMTRTDQKVRCVIPKNVREMLKLREESLFKGRVEDVKTILEPISVAEKYFGVFKMDKSLLKEP